MSKSLGDFMNNVKIKKRKREMVSDSDSDISRNTKKNKKKRLNGEDVQFSIKQERISDTEDHNFISKRKKHKKSTSRASEEENNVEEPVRRTKNGKVNHEFSSISMKKSSTFEDNDTFSDEAKHKKSKKRAKEQFNSTNEEIFGRNISKSTNEEEPTKSNHVSKEHSSSQRKSINPPSAEYSRAISKILSDFENKNESLKKVCCEDLYINNLHSNSSAFIVQVPINLNPTELLGKEISFLKKKKIKTDDGKYITTSSHLTEPVMLTTNSQFLRVHPTSVVTFERDCKIEDSETFNVPNFANNLGVNVIDPACLTRKNPIIGLEKEECERVLSSSVENKLKAAEKMYKKYKNKKVKKLSTQNGINQENIKDEEIFKYLSQPSVAI